MNSTSGTARSWREAMRQYEQEKRQTITHDLNIVPKRSYRDERFNKFAEERSYNPIEHRYLDPAKEEQVCRTEEKQKIDSINHAKVNACILFLLIDEGCAAACLFTFFFHPE